MGSNNNSLARGLFYEDILSIFLINSQAAIDADGITSLMDILGYGHVSSLIPLFLASLYPSLH